MGVCGADEVALANRASRLAGGVSALIRLDMPKVVLLRLMRTGLYGSVSG